MRPLNELPTGDIRGVFSDVDDTLTTRHRLVPAAYAALCEAVDAGLRVMLATGRPGGYAEVLSTLFPVAAVVSENGAYAVLHDGTRRFWDPADVRAEQRRRLDALVAEAQRRLPFAVLADDHPLRRVDVAFDIHERRHLEPAQVSELSAFIREAGARVLVSSIHAHAYFGDHDKAKMLVRLASELWGEAPEAVQAHYVFAGDSPNDQAGFAFFACAVGVANVRRYEAQLDPPPPFVAEREGGEGFAEIIRHVLRR